MKKNNSFNDEKETRKFPSLKTNFPLLITASSMPSPPRQIRDGSHLCGPPFQGFDKIEVIVKSTSKSPITAVTFLSRNHESGLGIPGSITAYG
jgi:hypothetical protein